MLTVLIFIVVIEFLNVVLGAPEQQICGARIRDGWLEMLSANGTVVGKQTCYS
jgi:hypothetical protein